MDESIPNQTLKLDPWAASSLLQKAIRRGEAQLAKLAAQAFYRHRGKAIFRRLCGIVFEDVGIADIQLVQEVARIATDQELRSVLGSDNDLIDGLCDRMAASIKDRSADYLYCAATKLESARQERLELERLDSSELMAIAANEQVPLIRRANASLISCTSDRRGEPVLHPTNVARLLELFSVRPVILEDAILQMAKTRSHPFCLMLPLVWSRWWHSGAEHEVADDELPTPEFIDLVPLYTFDKHTAAGKTAVATMVKTNSELRELLARWVPQARWVDVASVAAFYADAAPIVRGLRWSAGSLLAHTGFIADMTGAGCECDGALPILRCVRSNLPHLNELRRKSVDRRASARLLCN